MPFTGSASTTKDRKFNTYFTCGNAVIFLHVSTFLGHPQGGIQQRDIPQWPVMVFISVFIYAFVFVCSVCLLSSSLNTWGWPKHVEGLSHICILLFLITMQFYLLCATSYLRHLDQIVAETSRRVRPRPEICAGLDIRIHKTTFTLQSRWMWRRVVWCEGTDVSEKPAAQMNKIYRLPSTLITTEAGFLQSTTRLYFAEDRKIQSQPQKPLWNTETFL